MESNIRYWQILPIRLVPAVARSGHTGRAASPHAQASWMRGFAHPDGGRGIPHFTALSYSFALAMRSRSSSVIFFISSRFSTTTGRTVTISSVRNVSSVEELNR